MAATRGVFGCLRHFSTTRPSFVPLKQSLNRLPGAGPPGIASNVVFIARKTPSPSSPFRNSNILTQSLILRVRFASSSPSPVSISSQALSRTFFTSSHNFSQAHSPDAPLPQLTPPSVARWLLGSAFLVFTIIVVGGVTRLTESGLSITEWKPVTGTLPPLSQAQWEEEFEKYKLTPEFKMLNHRMTLEEFKGIYFWEYSHRLLGRTIGACFVIPFAYFYFRKRLGPGVASKLMGYSLLLGFQGALGWYMVKSGLEESIMTTPGAVPRVSQYRLAAHLGTALLLFMGMLGTGLTIRREWNWASYASSGKAEAARAFEAALANPVVRKFHRASKLLTGLVFLTAISGAFVAGLDAGLVYNEFPMMGERIVPPMAEMFSAAYAKLPDGSDAWWRNLLENPTTVQFDHRLLATTTYLSTTALFLSTYLPSVRSVLPTAARRLTALAFITANIQVTLGISTLLMLVPVPLAAAHQAGSVALLTVMVALWGSLKNPGRTARLWREAAVRVQAKRP